jgi:DNA polymerase-4
VHLALRKLISNYTAEFDPKSIDEFVLKLTDYPILKTHTMCEVAKKIKSQIKSDIGEWITVSIGIAPNRFLAKVASNLHKPDGLDEITKDNYLATFSKLKLTDLCGIKTRSAVRLAAMGIYTVIDFYNAELWKLKAAFSSIAGYYWYLRLKGYEIDDFNSSRKTFGNSYAFPKPLASPEEISPILSKLVEKMGFRLRDAGYKARGVHLAISFRDGSFWHQGTLAKRILYDSRDFYKEAYRLLLKCPQLRPVRDLSVSVFGLLKADSSQLNLFEDVVKKERLVNSTDKINNRWGNFVLSPARMIGMENAIVDRISFGGIRELSSI